MDALISVLHCRWIPRFQYLRVKSGEGEDEPIDRFNVTNK